MWNMMGKWIRYKSRVYKDNSGKRVEHYKIPAGGTAMVIGRRWLPNGHIDEELEGYDQVTRWFTPDKKPTPVYLVVKNDREKPFWVSPDGVETIDGPLG